jgi:hypothetical protein
MKLVRIYDGLTMKLEKDIHCVGVILAVEFCPNKNSIAVSLSDRTIKFYDPINPTDKILQNLHVPST